MKEPIVLIHGAWHGPWCWKRLQQLLEERGHPVFCPTLPCNTSQTDLPITLDLYLSLIKELLGTLPSPAVLVGHSLSGVLLLKLAEQVPQAIRELVFLCAFLPKPGECVLDLAHRDTEADMGPAFVDSGDPNLLVLDPVLAMERFCPEASEEEREVLGQHLVPHALRPMIQTLRYDPEKVKQLPCRYIACERDRAVSLKAQLEMAKNLDCEVETLPSSHSPFWSHPERLAKILLHEK